MTPTVCPGSCNNAWRRAEAALADTDTGTEHALTPNWGHPAHCDGCIHHTRKRIGELPELLTAIHLEALHGTRVKTSGTIGRIHTPAWPGEATRQLLDLIIGGMDALTDDILILRGLRRPDAPPADPVSEAARINRSTRLLGAHCEWAMQHHPCATELWDRDSANPASQIAAWHRMAERFTRRDPQRDTVRLAPCPRCHGPYLVEARDLRLVDGQPYIECRDPDCRRIMTRREYDTYVKELNTAIVAAA